MTIQDLSDDLFEDLRAEARPVRPRGLYRRGGKRCLDLLLVLLMLPVALPLVALLALAVMADGGAPFFGHWRIGRGGRPFRCWKLRSMVTDAESRLAAHLAADPEAAAEWARDRKLARDPRVTRVGAALRRSSLDELPQLFNVLRGEMSLVGPRPIVAEEEARYGAAAAYYRLCRPGITGPWQVSGRNGTGYAERVRLDLDYARAPGLRRDLAILLCTAREVCAGSGR